MALTTRTIEVEVELYGDGRVVETSPGHFVGGVPEPKLSDGVWFNFYEGIKVESDPMSGRPGNQNVRRLHVEIAGTSNGYRELARYFLALAELDTSVDPDFHEHHDNLLSADGQSMVQIVVRKHDSLVGG